MENIKEKVLIELQDELEGFELVKDPYCINEDVVLWFSKGVVDKYVITNDGNVIDIQYD